MSCSLVEVYQHLEEYTATVLAACLVHSSTLKEDAVHFPQMLATSIRLYSVPLKENHILHGHCHENLKSTTSVVGFVFESVHKSQQNF
jgi:hypothetical protein